MLAHPRAEFGAHIQDSTFVLFVRPQICAIESATFLQATQTRIDGVDSPESADAGPEVLKSSLFTGDSCNLPHEQGTLRPLLIVTIHKNSGHLERILLGILLYYHISI